MARENFETYMNDLSKIKKLSDNPFAHAEKLLENEPGEVGNESQIFDKQAMLAIIKDDKMVRLYQRQFNCVTTYYIFSKIDKRFEGIFKASRARLYAELGFTRAKEGEERKHHAELGGFRPTQELQGYGSIPDEAQTNQVEAMRNFLRGLKRG